MKREDQKQHFLDLIDLVERTGELLSESLRNKDKIDENIRKITKYETDGDVIQHELDDHFRNQRNIPYLALDRAKLLRRIDDILDDEATAARTLEVFSSSLPGNFSEMIAPLAEHVLQISKDIKDAVHAIYTSFEECLRLVEKIEQSRDNAMAISFDLEKYYFENLHEPSNWKEFESSTRIIRKSMKVISSIKAASEILELMAIKYD